MNRVSFKPVGPRTVVHFSECEGVIVLEPMRFLTVHEARARAGPFPRAA